MKGCERVLFSVWDWEGTVTFPVEKGASNGDRLAIVHTDAVFGKTMPNFQQGRMLTVVGGRGKRNRGREANARR
jgi:hypothetical protein